MFCDCVLGFLDWVWVVGDGRGMMDEGVRVQR